MKPPHCDHVFRDSKTCLRCGVHVLVLGLEVRFEALVEALGARYEQGRYVLQPPVGTPEAEIGRMHQDLLDFNQLRMEEHRLMARFLASVRDTLQREIRVIARLEERDATKDSNRIEAAFHGCVQLIAQLGKGPRLEWPEAMP